MRSQADVSPDPGHTDTLTSKIHAPAMYRALLATISIQVAVYPRVHAPAAETSATTALTAGPLSGRGLPYRDNIDLVPAVSRNSHRVGRPTPP
jgi:hypothetical protein